MQINDVHEGQVLNKMHKAIQIFKQKQYEKNLLLNKINVIKNQYERTKRKNKNIEKQIKNIKNVQNQYRQSKQEINRLLNLERNRHRAKIEEEKTKRQISNQHRNILISKITEEKKKDYERVKSKQNLHDVTIYQNWQRSLYEKRQKSLQIKMREEESKLLRAIFLQDKRLKAQRASVDQLRPIEYNTYRNERYIECMKQIENEITGKLQSSRASLNKSKISLKKIIRY